MTYLLGGLLFASAVAACVLYMQVQEEAGELSDYQLRQVAAAFPRQVAAEQPEDDPEDIEEDTVVTVWDKPGKQVYSSRPSLRLPYEAAAGYSTARLDDQQWRVYVQSSGSRSVEVAQPLSVRRSMAAELALRSTLPFLILVPLLALVIGLVVGRALRPLRQLAAAIVKRSPDSLAPLDLPGLPPEVQPMLEALNELLARLRSAVETQRAFVADAAHELRTPLTALKLQLQLAERASTDEARREAFGRLHSRLDRSSHLIQQLLALARHESAAGAPDLGPVDLASVARQVVAEKNGLAEEHGIDLGVESAADRVVVAGDADSLSVLLGNLIDNAIRHSPRGGRIDVAVESAAGLAAVRVIDNGPGIPLAERARVFDRFYRRPGTKDGTGLGLAIALSIARRHDATLLLEDAPAGKGLMATLRFPGSSISQTVEDRAPHLGLGGH